MKKILIFFLQLTIILGLNIDDRLKTTGTFTTRVYLWGLALTAIQDSPILGHGIGNQTNAMFSKENEFLFVDINKANSVYSFQQQSVHQYLLDGILSQGILFIIPFILTFISILRFKISDFSYDIHLHSFFLSIKIFSIAFFIFLLINVSQQHYLYFSLLGFFKKIKRIE